MLPAQVRRYARHLALPEIGVEGQERICAAQALIVGDDLASQTAREYMVAAGVGGVRAVADDPRDGAQWLALIEGAALIVRGGFGDDPMLRAAVRLGVPAVFMRGADDVVDVISFRRHGPCPHAALEVPFKEARPIRDAGPEAVVAGALAAAEALGILAAPGAPPRARHLRLPLDGGEPVAQEIPWAPECFVCGGQWNNVGEAPFS